MRSIKRECASCAARRADGAQLPPQRPARQLLLCSACQPVDQPPDRIGPRRRITRRVYRNRARLRASSAQLDLVDLIRPPA